jgi:hypothetical protein
MGNTKPSTNKSEAQLLVDKYINSVDDNGKLKLPDELSEIEKELVRQAKRTRDAQQALSREQRAKIELEAQARALEELAKQSLPSNFDLSQEEVNALEELKFKDPDAYRLKVNELEAKAHQQREEELKEVAEKAKAEAADSFVAKSRIQVLEEFRSANPDIPLTDDVLVNDVPPRFMKELNEGKYDYQTYLDKVVDYLKLGKGIATPKEGESNSLGSVPGGTTPGKAAAEKQGRQDYKKMTF